MGTIAKEELILNYMVGIADIILTVTRRHRFIKIWNSIQDFDETFRLGRERDIENGKLHLMFRQTKFWLWTSLAIGCAGWTAVNQLGMHAFNEPYMQNVGYMITYVGTCISVFKFCGLTMLIGQRFAYLNQLVQEQRTKGMTARFELVEAEAVVKKVERSYNQLLCASEKLNEIYSCSLFLYLLNLFCHAVSNMYFFTIWTIVDPSYLKNPKVVFCLFIWLLIYLVQLLLLHVSCHFTSHEANRMANVLLDWRRHVERLSKQNSFRSTLHYLNRRLMFTAGGCFQVHLPLLTSTFGHLTTYLVILLQIPDNKDD